MSPMVLDWNQTYQHKFTVVNIYIVRLIQTSLHMEIGIHIYIS